MDGARDQFFPGAAFSGDKDRSVSGGDGLDGVEHLLHGLALADHVGRTLHFGHGLAQANVFLLYLAMGEGLLDLVGDVVGIERLGDVVIGAVLQRGHGGLDRGIAGHDDDEHFGIDLVHAALQFNAIRAAHFDIDQRQVPLAFSQAGERLLRVFGAADLITLFAKPFAQRVAHAEFVVDNEEFAFG